MIPTHDLQVYLATYANWYWFLAFVVLQLIDLWSSDKISKAGGRELNPVVRALGKRLGNFAALVALKVVLLAAVAAAVYFRQMTHAAFGLLCFIYVAICGWNIIQLRQLSDS